MDKSGNQYRRILFFALILLLVILVAGGSLLFYRQRTSNKPTVSVEKEILYVKIDNKSSNNVDSEVYLNGTKLAGTEGMRPPADPAKGIYAGSDVSIDRFPISTGNFIIKIADNKSGLSLEKNLNSSDGLYLYASFRDGKIEFQQLKSELPE